MKKIFFISILILLIYYLYPYEELDRNAKIDLIIVNKAERNLMVY